MFFSKRMMLIAFLASTTLVSCEKKEVAKNEEARGLEEIEKVRSQKIERFISIIWQVPKDEIIFDKIKSTYSFNGIVESKAEIERIYDLSNEYKLVYETTE
jgi:hypothetical protein